MGLHGEEQLQHCSFSTCTVKTKTAMQAELTEDIKRLAQMQVYVILVTGMIAVYHHKWTYTWT